MASSLQFLGDFIYYFFDERAAMVLWLSTQKVGGFQTVECFHGTKKSLDTPSLVKKKNDFPKPVLFKDPHPNYTWIGNL